MDTTLAMTSTLSVPMPAATSIAAPPIHIIQLAMRITGLPQRSANGTSHSESNMPMLPLAAMNDFSIEPASKAFTAINNKNVLAALSITPDAMERRRSNR